MSRSKAHDQRNAAIREAFLRPFELAAASPPTGQTISVQAQMLNLDHSIEEVPGVGVYSVDSIDCVVLIYDPMKQKWLGFTPGAKGARLHWLGNRSAEKIILYFHGGGFALPALNGHVIFWHQCLEYLKSKGQDVAITALEYGMTREVRYPTQISRGLEALRFILEKGYESPNIIIGGDSAGANLALSVISVFLHSLEGIQPLRLNEPLAGLLLISPWVSFSIESHSFVENANRDVIPEEIVNQLRGAYVDPGDENNFSEPIQADVSWWRDIPVKSILNIYGEAECLRDHIVQIGEKLTKAGNYVANVECPSHVHIDCILDAQAGMDAGPMSTRIWEWLCSVM